MEAQQVQAWFGIAQRVNDLLARPGARERFRERVREAAAEWLRRYEEKRKREETRHELAYRVGAPDHPLFDANRQGDKAGMDRENSFLWAGYITNPSEHGHSFPWQARLPAELSADLDPDDTFPLPVPDREVSLAERYAAVGAVYDALWRGDERIDPWAGLPWPKRSDPQADQSAREGIVFYKLGLVHLIHCAVDEEPARPSDQLGERDRAAVESWLADVEADLAGGPSPQGGKSETPEHAEQAVGAEAGAPIPPAAGDSGAAVSEATTEPPAPPAGSEDQSKQPTAVDTEGQGTLQPESQQPPAGGEQKTKRPCRDRDKLFLQWYESEDTETYHSHAKIRDRWNAMIKEKRAEVCPSNPNNVNRSTAIAAIKAAKRDRAEEEAT